MNFIFFFQLLMWLLDNLKLHLRLTLYPWFESADLLLSLSWAQSPDHGIFCRVTWFIGGSDGASLKVTFLLWKLDTLRNKVLNGHPQEQGAFKGSHDGTKAQSRSPPYARRDQGDNFCFHLSPIPEFGTDDTRRSSRRLLCMFLCTTHNPFCTQAVTMVMTLDLQVAAHASPVLTPQRAQTHCRTSLENEKDENIMLVDCQCNPGIRRAIHVHFLMEEFSSSFHQRHQ